MTVCVMVLREFPPFVGTLDIISSAGWYIDCGAQSYPGVHVHTLISIQQVNFKAADLQNILENQIFQNISSNTYNSC